MEVHPSTLTMTCLQLHPLNLILVKNYGFFANNFRQGGYQQLVPSTELPQEYDSWKENATVTDVLHACEWPSWMVHANIFCCRPRKYKFLKLKIYYRREPLFQNCLFPLLISLDRKLVCTFHTTRCKKWDAVKLVWNIILKCYVFYYAMGGFQSPFHRASKENVYVTGLK